MKCLGEGTVFHRLLIRVVYHRHSDTKICLLVSIDDADCFLQDESNPGALSELLFYTPLRQNKVINEQCKVNNGLLIFS